VPTTFVKGDLFEDTKPPAALAFAAERNGSMASGVAVAFAKRFPALATALAAHAAPREMQGGDVFAWRDGDVVVYALAILHGDEKAKLASLGRAIQKTLELAAADGVGRVSVARIGGLDPKRVKRVLEEAGAATPIEIVVFEQFVRARPS